MKKIILASALLLFVFATKTSFGETSKVKWLSITEAEALNKKVPKKFFIDIYTSWCGWCKKLDADTYSDSSVAAYINTHFYPVKLDAETQDSVHYNNKVYGYSSTYHVNMVSYEFCDCTGYPTLSFLNSGKEKLMQWPGYLGPKDMMNLLKYFGDDYYKKYNDYNTYIAQVVNKSIAPKPSTTPVPNGTQQGASVMKDGGKLIATTGTKYQWYDEKGPVTGATSMVFVPAKTGTYYFVGTDDNGIMLPPSQSVIFEFNKKKYKKALKSIKN